MKTSQTTAQFRHHRPPGPVRRAARPLAAFLLAAWVCRAAAAEPAAVPPTYHASLNTAMAAAAADQSLVLLIFGAEWCGPCQLLKRNTLSAPAFVRQESALHIAEVDIDANQKAAHDFAVEAVPTLILLTGEGKIIERQTGFMEIGALRQWLLEGRRRATAGEWEGTVPGPQIAEFARKAAADALGANDLEKLAGMLGETDPADRASAANILLAQREQAVPVLIEAVTNSLLGERIGASELLQQLAPGLDPVDPWQSPVALSNTVAGLRTWWAETGRLPAPAARPAVDLRSDNAVKEALEQLRGDDPGRRTAAMTLLAGQGTAVLPAVRAAVKRAESTGDQRTLGLLEDVRWTLLVPDALEPHGNGVRHVLAHGKSSERQAMTELLGHLGRDALGPLTELAGDSDPLVVESAVRALAGIGGDETVLVLASLLQAGDGNLRMTAAQALGHTKNARAVKPLLTVINDPNEVVACTALSALEETQTRDTFSPAQKGLSPEITAGLKLSLADTRWRVRAAAAEIAGKLSVGVLKDELIKLLDDPDGFVVKSALTALGKLNVAPEPAQLIALSKRLPGLQGDAVAVLLQSASEDTASTVTDLFNSGTADSRVAILNALAKRETPGDPKLDDAWKPLLTQAITSPDRRLRRSAAETLRNLAPKLGADLVDPLLADEDRETRQAAAAVVVRILAQDNHDSLNPRTSSASSSANTNQPVGTAAKLAAWHAALRQHPESAPTLNWAATLYVTGDGKTDLPVLQAALGQPEGGAGQSRMQREMNLAVMGLVLHKLPWPEGRPVLDTMASSPGWLALAASQNGQGRPEVREELLKPAQFKSAMERADGPALTEALELVAGYDYAYGDHSPWSLWTDSAATKAIALALAESTNAAWRAAAIFSLGLRADATESRAAFEQALADPSPWVRESAIKAMVRIAKDRLALEQPLTPMLADTNLLVAATAAVSLLEPEIRAAAGLGEELNLFVFESVRGGRVRYDNETDDRPVTTLDTKPAYLPTARAWVTNAPPESAATFAVLLAQHGEFDGVNRLVSQWVVPKSRNETADANVILTGIALSRDAKYLPVLKQMAAARSEEPELRKVLQAMKGMSGPDARQLRLEINKKIRTTGGSGNTMD